MKVTLSSIDEVRPGPKWAARYDESWPAYQKWFLGEGLTKRPSAKIARRKLAQFMPELAPVYDDLCSLVGDDEVCHRFLALYNPPRLAVGCSQLVWTGAGGPLLMRNYDFSPDRWEALLMRSQWRQKRVFGMVDCLWGLLDGLNESGLAVSLAFGGDPKVGSGFAIPIIVRYVLENCATVHEAKEALRQVPSSMAYNLTLLDRSGAFTTAFLAPGKVPKFKSDPCATNHQAVIHSKRYAIFTRTVERANFLGNRLAQPKTSSASLLSDLLSPPLYARSWSRGFGTLYTAVYDPQQLKLTLVWPGMRQSHALKNFKEFNTQLRFDQEHVGPHLPPRSLIG
jgi:predicted choloylglycine hydrolase